MYSCHVHFLSIPVIASPTTLAILKAWRDSAPASLGNEITYLAFKKPAEDCGYVPESERGKDYTRRDFYATSEYMDR